MNLQQMRYLVAVVDHGTMTAVALQMHVSQPALSRAIRDLESEPQLTLFNRVGRNVIVEPAAQDVIAAARRVLNGVDELVDAARAARVSSLTLCTTSSMEELLTRRVMPTYTERVRDPHVRMVHADGPDRIEEMVMGGFAELGLIDREPACALTATRFGDEEVVLVSPPNVVLPDPLPLHALDGLRLILPTQGSPRRHEFDAFFSAIGVRPIVALETDERASWTSAVVAQVGSVLWFEANAQDAVRRGAQIRPLTPPIQRALHFIHRHNPLSGPGAAFLQTAADIG